MKSEDIMNLSSAEKILLVAEIWDSIDKTSIDMCEAQKQEIERRLDKDASGKCGYLSWDEVKQRLRK